MDNRNNVIMAADGYHNICQYGHSVTNITLDVGDGDTIIRGIKCGVCNVVLQMDIQSESEIHITEESMVFQDDSPENYLRSDWIRCPRCLNNNASMDRRGIVECNVCELDVWMNHE